MDFFTDTGGTSFAASTGSAAAVPRPARAPCSVYRVRWKVRTVGLASHAFAARWVEPML